MDVGQQEKKVRDHKENPKASKCILVWELCTSFQLKERPRSVYNPKPREMREYSPINEAHMHYKNLGLSGEKGEVLH